MLMLKKCLIIYIYIYRYIYLKHLVIESIS